MPQLLAFLPCEKAIIANDSTLSLIGLIETLTANIPAGAGAIQPNAVAPFRGALVAIYKRQPGEEGKRFRQRIVLVLPNGQAAGESASEFDMPPNVNMVRNISGVDAFPVGLAGECKLRLYLEEVGKPVSAEPVAEYGIHVVHNQTGG